MMSLCCDLMGFDNRDVYFANDPKKKKEIFEIMKNYTSSKVEVIILWLFTELKTGKTLWFRSVVLYLRTHKYGYREDASRAFVLLKMNQFETREIKITNL